MKRYKIALGLALAAIMGVNAESPINIGIKGGITSSTFTIDKVESIYYGDEQFNYTGSDFKKDASNGLGAGVFLRLKYKNLFLQPEANFLVRNGKMNLNVESVSVNPENNSAQLLTSVSQGIQLATLDIPILVGVKLIDLKVLKLNLFTGPSASILLNEKIDLTPQFQVGTSEVTTNEIAINQPFTDEFDIEQELKSANWNWQVGAGADIGNFYLDVRYEYGINSITTLDFEQKSNVLMFSLGFRFL